MKRCILFILLLIIICVSGCKKRVETATYGHRLVLVADPYMPLIKQEVDEFISLYPEVKMEVYGASTREAIVHLLNDSVRSIVIDRPLNEEEQQVARQAAIRIVENKIAEDGIAIIVHKFNPIATIDIETIRLIISRDVKDWRQIPKSRWSGAIDLVLTGRNSGINELLQRKIFNLSKSLEPSAVFGNQFEVIKYVSMHPSSVGLVAASMLTNRPENIKVVPVVVRSPEGGENEYFPGQQEIYESLYPFHYSLYLYNAEAKAAVGIGFGAFILSNIGQKIIQKAGLVPASMPYRTIQLNAE
jgi:phosphate transport system substrate-binding protein